MTSVGDSLGSGEAILRDLLLGTSGQKVMQRDLEGFKTKEN